MFNTLTCHMDVVAISGGRQCKIVNIKTPRAHHAAQDAIFQGLWKDGPLVVAVKAVEDLYLVIGGKLVPYKSLNGNIDNEKR